MSLQIQAEAQNFSELIPQTNHTQTEQLIREYSKQQFVSILIQLAHTDPAYYCERRQLEDIYNKVIESRKVLKGTDISEFASALKDRNFEAFGHEIEYYRDYTKLIKKQGGKTVSKEQFLKCLADNSLSGYLTQIFYPLARQGQVISMEKLNSLLDQIEQKFINEGAISIPQKVSIVQTEFQGYDLAFETAVDQLASDRFQQLRDTVTDNIENAETARAVQRQIENMKLQAFDLKEVTVPELQKQLNAAKKEQIQTQADLNEIYEDLQAKNEQVIILRNEIMELTAKQMEIKQEMVQVKIQLNQKQEENYQLLCKLKTLESDLFRQKQLTKEFMQENQDLKTQYLGFMQKKEKEDQERRTQKQKSFYPTLSLKQQLEDATFKVKKLKDQKAKLSAQLQTNQQAFQVRIQALQQELIQARNEIIRATKLRQSGMSRLSNNFQASRRTCRQSIFSSIMSAMSQSQNKQEKVIMNNLIQESDHTLLQPSSLSKYAFKKKKQTVNLAYENSGTVDFKQDQFNHFSKEIEESQPIYNFHDQNFEHLKNALGKQNAQIIMEENKDETVNSGLINDDIVLRRQQQEEIKNRQLLLRRKQKQQRQKVGIFVCSCEIISKSGDFFRKFIILNGKGIYYLDTKLRLEKEIKYSKIRKIIFTYYNVDTFLISYKRSESPMKKEVTSFENDLIFKCLKTKELLSFISQPHMKSLLLAKEVRVTIEKQEDYWIKESTKKDILLSKCGNFYNPFRLNLSLINYQNRMFYAEISRQALLSRSFITICVVEAFGIYCFEWTQKELEGQRNFIQLLPLVKRMKINRQEKSVTIKIVYSEWSDGKTFLLRFKNARESYKFVIMCQTQRKMNENALIQRKKQIQRNGCTLDNLSQGKKTCFQDKQ